MKRVVLLVVACVAVVLALTLGSQTHSRAPSVRSLPPAAMGSVSPLGWGGTPSGVTLPPSSPRFALAPTATMVDGIYVSDFSGLSPFAVAGYTAGIWPDYLGLRAAFPTAHAISVAIASRFHADCADIEPGDMSPQQAGPWAVADINAGFVTPCVYSDLAEMPAVKASLAASLGSNWRAKVLLWLAWYRYVPGLVAGYDAVQYDDHCLNRNLDCSTVSLRFLTIAQPPYRTPVPPAPPKPKPVVWSYAKAFNIGFQRGFTVAWDEAHGLVVSRWTVKVPSGSWSVVSYGFQLGFQQGW